jgi:hypothetical protein
LIGTVLKTVDRFRLSVDSNPTPSAFIASHFCAGHESISTHQAMRVLRGIYLTISFFITVARTSVKMTYD